MTFEEWKDKNLVIDKEDGTLCALVNHMGRTVPDKAFISYDTFEDCWNHAIAHATSQFLQEPTDE